MTKEQAAELQKQIRALRKQVKKMQELGGEWSILSKTILANMPTDKSMNLINDIDKLRYYLHEQVDGAFFSLTSALHKLWDTYK